MATLRGLGRIALLTLLLVPLGWTGRAAAHEPAANATTDDPAQQLAERFAPLILVQRQEQPCGDGEPYTPMSVDALLGNPQIALRQVGVGNPVVMWAPTAADLYDLGDGFYLDYPGEALAPGCLYERDSRRYNQGREPTVYAHIVEHAGVDDDGNDRLVIEYWFFWYFNDWNNKHEGDWEGVQVVFDVPTIAEALATQPVEVGFAQHEGGQRADWDGDTLELDGDRPIVYPSVGSHASYLGSAVFLGRGASEGFGCDDTGSETSTIDPAVVVLPDRPSGPDDPFAWLAFRGHWGERREGPYNGPTGPANKGRYLKPIPWQDDLRDSSVVVPAGDSQLHSIVSVFCSVVAYGSNQVIAFQLSPTRALVTLGLLAAVVLFVLRRTAWRPAEPHPLLWRRRGGQVITAALRTLGRGWWLFLVIGVAAIPLGALAGALLALVRLVPFVGGFVDLFSKDEGSQLLVSMLAGGATSVLTYVFVAAAAAWTTAEVAAGRRPRPSAVLRAVAARWRPLVGAFLLAFVVVAVLFVTVIGAPVAIYLLVRFQFIPQVAMLEDVAGRPHPNGTAVILRSMALVRRRWWHTGWMVVLIHAAAAVTVTAIGLLVLVALQLPFWALSATMTIAQLLAIPLAASAVTFLYGDAAAAHAAAEAEGDLATPTPAPA
jgi:hypothetical protein